MWIARLALVLCVQGCQERRLSQSWTCPEAGRSAQCFEAVSFSLTTLVLIIKVITNHAETILLVTCLCLLFLSPNALLILSAKVLGKQLPAHSPRKALCIWKHSCAYSLALLRCNVVAIDKLFLSLMVSIGLLSTILWELIYSFLKYIFKLFLLSILQLEWRQWIVWDLAVWNRRVSFCFRILVKIAQERGSAWRVQYSSVWLYYEVAKYS